MKNLRAVYTKLRDVKHHHTVKLYKKYLRKIPENCKYNKLHYIYGDEKKAFIRLCLLHQSQEKGYIHTEFIDVCQIPEHCTNCNAFICKYEKKDIQLIFSKELEDIKTKQKKYPDITALEWVLEQSATLIFPFNHIQIIYYKIKRLFMKNLL